MEDPAEGSSVQVVTDPEQAALLIDRGELRFLAPFIGLERSVGEAARDLGVSVDFLLSRVKRLERKGLIRIVRTVPRKGRAVKRYAAASEFFIPLSAGVLEKSLLKSETFWHGAFMRGLERSMLSILRDNPAFGARVHRDPEAGVLIQPGAAPGVTWTGLGDDDPALAFEWRALELTPEDAKALQRELAAVAERYTAKQRAGQARYLLGALLTPESG